MIQLFFCSLISLFMLTGPGTFAGYSLPEPPDSVTVNMPAYEPLPKKFQEISGFLGETDSRTGLHTFYTGGLECEILLQGKLMGFHQDDQVEIVALPAGYSGNGLKIYKIVGIFDQQR